MSLNILKRVHHIAIICTDYQRSKTFYTTILGLDIIREIYRETRKSYKLDLALNGAYIIELFSFESPPQRRSGPEAAGLRHLAFEVEDLDRSVAQLREKGVQTEAIRTDEFTGKRFTFFTDPDGLPLELYSG